MKHSYYSLPLRLGKVIRKKELARCSLEDSISDHIHLMITSHFNENKHDDKFGNSIWENEFGNISENHTIREEINRSVLRCINRYEPRLEQVRVNIRWLQEETGGGSIKRLSKRLDITITGTITVNRKPFSHEEQCYIAPMSYK
ncbi:Gene 25-like lysozyme [Fodinibius roseus]|uniref:Gene 25-like lysozyme n=1 Tax=Fodinibius roseus TaxID=1194090 RepID=A0A1M5A0U5_9BACT|nr:GPW/gp25 family protein [Fodinibius roseus]SHF23930.1 Gene 25-like lysozyme [Fodinibius roseus]